MKVVLEEVAIGHVMQEIIGEYQNNEVDGGKVANRY